MRSVSALIILLPWVLRAQDPQHLLSDGVSAFRETKYAEAEADFRRVLAAEPRNIQAHLYLGTALMAQYIPGAQGSENQRFADKARMEFESALYSDPNDLQATSSMAMLFFNEQKFDDASTWYRKVLAIDPDNKEALYSAAVITWTQFLPFDRQGRTDSNQRPGDPGPIVVREVREPLSSKWLPLLNEAIGNLEHALQIDPQYDDAMSYMNLLIRYRADLDSSADEYTRDVEQADSWMRRAVQAKEEKSGTAALPSVPPPPAPPSNSPGHAVVEGSVGSVLTPQQSRSASSGPDASPLSEPKVRIGSAVAEANLIQKAEPVYPPLAMAARISGTVRFHVLIGPDGALRNITLLSGHPLLVTAAKDAVVQYRYKPTLLNGAPVIVDTTIDVVFTLR